MKVSYIIPAYNSVKYLGKCLDSIFRQPFDDYEVIVVDDGSTDDTPQLLREYQLLDSRLRILTQSNSGQGAARTYGLSQARGDYIWFVDSDDWLLPSVMPRLSRLLDDCQLDVLVINFEFAIDGQPSTPSSFVPGNLAGQMVCPRKNSAIFAAVSCWSAPPWRLIARREHLLENGIVFAQGVFYEDHPFAIHLMLTANKVYVDAPVVYAYYQRSDSTTKVNDKKAFDFLVVRKQVLDLLRRHDVYESFSAIVIGYLMPSNFYLAHVSPTLQSEFLCRLNEETSADEAAYVERHGDELACRMLLAARTGSPGMMATPNRLMRLATSLKELGLKRVVFKVRDKLLMRLLGLARRLRDQLARQAHQAGVDTTGRRFLVVGPGTRIEPIYIDVRLTQESRPYVHVGADSHVGGTFVFERGIGELTIGDRSSIGGGCKFICTQEQGIHIGSNVMLSWDCTVMDSNAHSLDPDVRANDAYDWKCGVDANRWGGYKDWSQVASAPIYIEDNAWLGFEVAVMKGVRIGRGAVVGARSVVTSNLAPYGIYGGCPAKFIDYVPRQSWSWEDIVHAAQGDPQMQPLLRDAFLHHDLGGSLRRYRDGEEFRAVLAEIACLAPGARRILDVGGGNGVMSVAFALAGFDVTLVELSEDDLVGTGAAHKLIAIVEREMKIDLSDRLTIVTAPLEKFESGNEFDVVHCRQAAHHFRDPAACVKKISALMSSGALIMMLREHVIFDCDDLELFLRAHPFHRYTGGEYGYSAAEYEAFLLAADFELVRRYAFAESPINYYPHDKDVVSSLDERQVAGRPYSFIARRK